jgi:4-hydroxy-2-oxoheptanedioate aldolase
MIVFRYQRDLSRILRLVLPIAAAILAVVTLAWPAAVGGQAPAPSTAQAASAAKPEGWAVRASLNNPTAPLYNKAKQKLLDGGQINTFAIDTRDPKKYCEVAPHYDYIFLEMQHSTMSFADIEAMIAACPRVGTPIIRVADVLESTLQKAGDIGALGIIAPTVDTVEQAWAAAKYMRYPPEGRRSLGRNQAGSIWGVNGVNYRQTINDNMLVVVQIETPVGVENAYDIARVPGVDALWASNGDLGNFTGLANTSPAWHAMFTKIHDDTLRAGKFLAATSPAYGKTGPNGRPDGPDWRMFYVGGPSLDGYTPPR